MREEKKPEIPHTPLYSFLRPVMDFLFRTVYPMRVLNRQGLRKLKAPYLLIANHNSNWDAVLLGWLCPYELRCMGKRELIRGRLTRWLFEKQLHMIPISRQESDIQAMRACMNALKEGHVLCVFPEGTRRLAGLMEKVEKGVAFLAMRQRVDMVPVYIDRKPRPFHLTRAIIGDPLPAANYPPGPYSEAKADQLCETIRRAFYDLRDRLRQT